MALKQRLFKTGAAILLQRFFRDDERENFALGDLHRGKAADFAGVKIAVALAIEFNRQVQPVAHELDVAMDGLGGDFDFARKLAGVGKSAGLQCLMNPQHPLQRRTRMERGLR